MSKSLPEYWFVAIRRMPPVEAPVVAGSTPVVSFGAPSRAAVATLGINPSAKEFCDRDGLLTGPERRLATLDSLGAERLDQLTDCQVAAVAKHCQDYFERQPYRKWFDPLDRLLRSAIGASYYDRTACHLDLIQWATDPVWGQIRDRSIKKALLANGVSHLRAQLTQERFQMILLNGRQVLKQVQELELVDLDKEGCLTLGKVSCSLYVGDKAGVRWVGWSANLQSSRGVSRGFKEKLAKWVKDVSERPGVAKKRKTSSETLNLNVHGHLPQGLRISGKSNFVELLRRWLIESNAPTIGDVCDYGRRPWLLIEIGSEEVVVNADTSRRAVIAFVEETVTNPEGPWRVVANRRGRINKINPGPAGIAIPGWYVYLSNPRSEEGVI